MPDQDIRLADLVVVALLGQVVLAAKSYVERYGAPRTIEELLRHRICIQVAQQVADTMPGYDQLFPGVPQPGFVAIRNNVSSAHYWSIAKGAGIGLLPTYASAIGAAVVPIDLPGVYFPSDIWMAYHPDAARIPRVRRLLDWVIESFDGQKFPWFRNEFIHPRDLPESLEGEAAINMFAGFGSERVIDKGDDHYAMTA
jgi:DNA-binding transcriptional LysR family regulator